MHGALEQRAWRSSSNEAGVGDVSKPTSFLEDANTFSEESKELRASSNKKARDVSQTACEARRCVMSSMSRCLVGVHLVTAVATGSAALLLAKVFFVARTGDVLRVSLLVRDRHTLPSAALRWLPTWLDLPNSRCARTLMPAVQTVNP